jgi:predicted nucleotidyltransferase
MLDSKKWKIIRQILGNPEDEIHVRDIAKKLKVSPGLVSITVNEIKNLGFLKNGKADLENPQVRAYKIMLNSEVLATLIPLAKNLGARGLGIYGSYAKGTNTKDSDVDIWIKIDKYPEAATIAKFRADVRKKINTEPSLFFLTDEKISNLREENSSLYFSMYYGLLLWGEDID